MGCNKKFVELDPSRFVVYQALGDLSFVNGFKVIKQETDNLFLIKTEPVLDSLYNYVHILGSSCEAKDLKTIKDFFQDIPYRIKTNGNKKLGEMFLSHGFKLKDEGYNMLAREIENNNYDFELPGNVEIRIVSSLEELGFVKKIFAETFNHIIGDYDKKFSFL